jgi:hypothetical protein
MVRYPYTAQVLGADSQAKPYREECAMKSAWKFNDSFHEGIMRFACSINVPRHSEYNEMLSTALGIIATTDFSPF